MKITKTELLELGSQVERVEALEYKLNKRYELSSSDKDRHLRYHDMMCVKYGKYKNILILNQNGTRNALFTLMQVYYTNAVIFGDYDILYNSHEINQYLKIID